MEEKSDFDFENDPLYAEAIAQTIWAFEEGSSTQKAKAVSDLALVITTIIFEKMTDSMLGKKS